MVHRAGGKGQGDHYHVLQTLNPKPQPYTLQGKKGEATTIMLYRKGMRDDVFSEFADQDPLSSDDD